MIKTITALMVLTLVATISMSNAYAIDGDGTNHVEVDEYPFNITILEGGSMTLHNNGENTISFVSHGWFEGSVPANDAIALEFPVVNCGTTCFIEGMYYISDLNGGYQSTIKIVKPYVAPEPIYVESISQAENFTVEMTENGFSTNELQINAGDSVTFVNTHYVTDINVEPHAISDPFAVPYTEYSYWIIDDSTLEQVYNFDSCESFVFYDRFFDVEPITVQCNVEQVGIQESIVVLTPESTLELIVDEGIYNVATYDGEVDLITMQTQLAEVTAQFNESITKLADQKLAIESYNNEVQSLTTQIGTLNGTATEVSTLEQTVLSLQLEKDTLNAQILTLGNTTAIQQTTITQLNAQVNDTSILDSKITNLEAQVVSLTSERNQWKQLANNWYGIAMEQLSVMINVLGI
jgi:uncharacterized coiled-coil protein SlyX